MPRASSPTGTAGAVRRSVDRLDVRQSLFLDVLASLELTRGGIVNASVASQPAKHSAFPLQDRFRALVLRARGSSLALRHLARIAGVAQQGALYYRACRER